MKAEQKVIKNLEKENQDLRNRLWSGRKVTFQSSVWAFPGEDWLQYAVRTIQAQGFKAELRFEDGKLKLYSVRYELV